MIESSKPSIRRFIKYYLGINPTPYWFHQTLTFQNRVTSEKEAKRHLKRLLDSLEKDYTNMAAFFVQGIQQNEGIHFHLIFMMFGEQPESPDITKQSLGKDVFARWNRIHENLLSRQANLMTLRKKDDDCIWYLLKRHISPTDDKLPRQCLWNGVRNRRLSRLNSLPVSKQQVSETYYNIFPKPPKPVPPLFTKQNMQVIRNYIEGVKNRDWASYKRAELKSTKRVSDAAYMQFQNKERTEMLAKRRPKSEPKPELDF